MVNSVIYCRKLISVQIIGTKSISHFRGLGAGLQSWQGRVLPFEEKEVT